MIAAVFLESLARPLLLVHAVVGFAAVFAATHLAAYALVSREGRTHRPQLRRFSWIAPAAVGLQFALGLLLYPSYRVHVRAADLDRTAPFVSQLFDFKEHLAALALALVCAAAVSVRLIERAPEGPGRIGPVRALAGTAAALLWVVALCGLYVTARHPVGTP